MREVVVVSVGVPLEVIVQPEAGVNAPGHTEYHYGILSGAGPSPLGRVRQRQKGHDAGQKQRSLSVGHQIVVDFI